MEQLIHDLLMQNSYTLEEAEVKLNIAAKFWHSTVLDKDRVPISGG